MSNQSPLQSLESLDDFLRIRVRSATERDAAGEWRDIPVRAVVAGSGLQAGDVFNYGAVSDATFLTGLAAAVSAGVNPIIISQDYTVDMSSHLTGITIPATGVHLIGVNGAKLTFTGTQSGELFAGVANTTGGDIRFENLHIVTSGTDRITLVDFEDMVLIDNFIVAGCTFEGRSRFVWTNDASVDPAVTAWGMTRGSVTNNHFENHNSRFINFTAVLYDYFEFSDNTAHNYVTCLCYLASSSAFSGRIHQAHKEFVFNRNSFVNDDTFWSTDPEGSYTQPALVTAMNCHVGWNYQEGVKTDANGVDRALYYLTSGHVYCHNNTAKNCGNIGTGGDSVIFHSKSLPTLPTGEIGSVEYHNNTLILDPEYFSKQGKADPIWYLYKITEVRAKFTNNYVDVPKLTTMGITNSAAVFHSFEWIGNTLIVRDSLENASVLRIEQAAASDSTERFDISDNYFDIAAYTPGDGQFIRISSDVSHTRASDGATVFPSTVHFNNNRIKMVGTWGWIFENSDQVTTFDGRGNVIEVDDFGQQAFSPRILFKDFQAKVIVNNQTSGNHDIWPSGEYTFFHDDHCDVDLEFVGSSITNTLPLPINTNVLGATTARVSVDCEVRQTDGDHGRGVFDMLFQDDGAGNLDMLFDVASSEVTAQIPDTTEQNGSNIDVTSVLQHGNNLFSAVALTNNVSRASFALPTGYQVRVRAMKRDL